jgi:hypothetical protein
MKSNPNFDFIASPGEGAFLPQEGQGRHRGSPDGVVDELIHQHFAHDRPWGRVISKQVRLQAIEQIDLDALVGPEEHVEGEFGRHRF